eukprot:927407-Pyramimonas_sp.AAC.1
MVEEASKSWIARPGARAASSRASAAGNAAAARKFKGGQGRGDGGRGRAGRRDGGDAVTTGATRRPSSHAGKRGAPR